MTESNDNEILIDGENNTPSRTPSYTRRPIHTIQLTRKNEEKKPKKYRSSVSGKPKLAFGGSLGALCLIVTLPLLVIFLNIIVQQRWQVLTHRNWVRAFRLMFRPKAFLITIAWLAASLLFYKLPIGRMVKGRKLDNGDILQYRCNGFLFFLCSISVFGVVAWQNVLPVHYLAKNSIAFATAATLVAIMASIALYASSQQISIAELSPATMHSGNAIYGFFMGRELNPRPWGIDVKFVCELRPGLIGWVLVNLSACIWQYRTTGGHVDAVLLLISATQTLYVADALWFEQSILSTMDIVEEGFGFMLVFGDLAWVPFTYSLQALHLVVSSSGTTSQSSVQLVVAAAVFGIGYYIFRSSNLQKDRFRRDQHSADSRGLLSIPTGFKDRSILCDGWWAWSRHPNYFGDILMAISWAMASGDLQSPIPYFYPIYLTVLLMSRELRDERCNLGKYGSAWTEYRRIVQYRICKGIW